MKFKYSVLLVAMFSSTIALANDNYRELNTEDTNRLTVELMQENAPSISAAVQYPGKLSGLCGITLHITAKNATIADLLKVLTVKAPFPQRWQPNDRIQILDSRTLAVKLFPEFEAYMATLDVSTRDGSSISQTLKNAFPAGDISSVKISGALCN